MTIQTNFGFEHVAAPRVPILHDPTMSDVCPLVRTTAVHLTDAEIVGCPRVGISRIHHNSDAGVLLVKILFTDAATPCTHI